MRVPIGHQLWLRGGRHADLADQAGDGEPATLPVSAALLARRRPGTRFVACVEDRGGALLGALVLDRVGVGRWDALPLVVDRRAVAVLARLVQWSWATRVYGVSGHVDPLVSYLGRVERSVRLPFYTGGLGGVEPGDLDPRTRRAERRDVPALVEVFGSYGLAQAPTRRARRRLFERTVAEHLAVVVEVDGQVVGASFGDGFGRDHVYLADGTIVTEHRGTGLSWPMVLRYVAIANDLGYMVCGSPTSSNPMDPAAHTAADATPIDEWTSVRLVPRLPEPVRRWRLRVLRWADRQLDRRGTGAPRA